RAHRLSDSARLFREPSVADGILHAAEGFPYLSGGRNAACHPACRSAARATPHIVPSLAQGPQSARFDLKNPPGSKPCQPRPGSVELDPPRCYKRPPQTIRIRELTCPRICSGVSL